MPKGQRAHPPNYVGIVWRQVAEGKYTLHKFKRGFATKLEARTWALKQGALIGAVRQDRWPGFIRKYGERYGYAENKEAKETKNTKGGQGPRGRGPRRTQAAEGQEGES